jgi:hypothetical protein
MTFRWIRRLRRVLLTGAMLAGVLAGVHPPGAAALQAQTIEEITASPEAAAELYLRSIRAIRWSAAAQFIDDGTLERFHQTVSMITEADSSGAMADFLVQETRPAVPGLEPAEIFDRAIGAMIDDMPGLMHAFFDRDDEVIGAVHEGDGDAHAVYRTTARISGAVPEVKVMQMRRSPRGWRVVWSDELEVLDAALRGVTRGR